jgi:hypothetical protein
MKRLAQLAGLILTIVFVPAVQATTLFQLAGSATVEAVDEAPSFSLTVDGITATLTANIGVLNTTQVSGFGVNAPGTGDNTSEIDGVLGTESVSIVFNVPVRLDQIVLSDFFAGAGDLAMLTIDGFPAITLNPTPSALDVYNFGSNNTVPVGQPIVLAYQAGNGFSFDSFSVTKIPEPASGLLLFVGFMALYGLRLRSHIWSGSRR